MRKVWDVDSGRARCKVKYLLALRLRVRYLDGLHAVKDGLGELVGGGLAAHVASADLAVEDVSNRHIIERMEREKRTRRQ